MSVDPNTMTDLELAQLIAQLRARLDAMPSSKARHQVSVDYIALVEEQMRRKQRKAA